MYYLNFTQFITWLVIVIIKLSFIECLPGSRYSIRHLRFIFFLSFYLLKAILWGKYHNHCCQRRTKWDSERLGHLPKLIQLVNRGAKICTQVSLAPKATHAFSPYDWTMASVIYFSAIMSSSATWLVSSKKVSSSGAIRFEFDIRRDKFKLLGGHCSTIHKVCPLNRQLPSDSVAISLEPGTAHAFG